MQVTSRRVPPRDFAFWAKSLQGQKEKQIKSFYHFGKKLKRKCNLLVTVLFVAVRAVKVLTSQMKICLSNPPEATISLLLA